LTQDGYLSITVYRNEAQKYYKDTLNDVEVVSSEQDILQMSFEHFPDAQIFTNKHILGTHLSYINYEVIKDKVIILFGLKQLYMD
jgi:hypothetical protein